MLCLPPYGYTDKYGLDRHDLDYETLRKFAGGE